MPKRSEDESKIIAGNPIANVTRTIVILFVVVALSAGFVLASEIVLILFLGLLFGVFLSHVTHWVNDHWPLGRGWSLAAVVTLLLLLMGGGTTFFFVQINDQIDQASTKIDEGVAELRQLVRKYPTVRSAVGSVPILNEALVVPRDENPRNTGIRNTGIRNTGIRNTGIRNTGIQNAGIQNAGIKSSSNDSGRSQQTESADDDQSGVGARQDNNNSEQPDTSKMDLSNVPAPVQQAVSTMGQLFRTTFGLVVNSLLIFFVGLFLAASPATYRDGVIRLAPLDRRERAGEVIDDVGDTLWRWLIGRFGSMLVTGIGAYLLLAVIGVPMAATLGILTGLLTFIPNIGAAIALMLAILFALPQGLAAAGMVLGAYLALQLMESYLVTPLIQQHQVSLPPALLIAFQALMGVLFGFIGAAVASPLLAASKTAIEMLYIEDYLGDDAKQA